MKKLAASLALGMTLAATALAGSAYAEQAARGQRGGDPDRTVTRAEAQTKAAERFARMDVNKDGKLDAGDRTARRNLMFDRFDTDKNGAISREEFAARPQRSESEAGKTHRWAGSGHHGRHFGGSGNVAANAGPVTQADFTARALARFDSVDANKDGQVTKEERQAARVAMRAQWQAKRAAEPAKSN